MQLLEYQGIVALPAVVPCCVAPLSLLGPDGSGFAACCAGGLTGAGGENREGIGSKTEVGRGPMHALSRRTMYLQWRNLPVT
jgi:hypothetical protein